MPKKMYRYICNFYLFLYAEGNLGKQGYAMQ